MGDSLRERVAAHLTYRNLHTDSRELLAECLRELERLEEHHEEHHAREETMRPRCVTCESEPNAAGPGCDCAHAPCVHDFNRLRVELTDAERRLQVTSQKLRKRAAVEWRAGTESNELHDWLRELAAALDAPGAK